MTLEFGKNKKLEQIPASVYDKLIEQDKEELWSDLQQQAEHGKDTKHHLAEFKNINQSELIDIDWIVLRDWEKMSEEDLNEIEKNERMETGELNKSRANLYALVRGEIIDKQIQERFDK